MSPHPFLSFQAHSSHLRQIGLRSLLKGRDSRGTSPRPQMPPTSMDAFLTRKLQSKFILRQD